ncbi:VOC family protein [Halotia branconii CENA392]|uniref:VOC family protein n=1 Tax=Halotia branconii CENA392 TaxID=1539056 RepID=A0AAJ6NXT6_9CYAN|nr:VOC family protein [Halotia branconii]WGV28729.1 VOC family protein [Halotia branconii CENA392]
MEFLYTEAFVTIASMNLVNLVDFYTQFLGEKPISLIPNVYAEFQLSGVRLGIFQPQTTQESEFNTSAKSTMSLCLEVSNLEDAIAHLKTLGYPPLENILIASHGREIYAYDPDGNRLILHQKNL